MWRRFTSTSVHKVDAKGRVSVPAPFRRVLEQAEGEGFVLIPNFQNQNCIECFTMQFAEQIEDAINRMRPFSPERRRMEHTFLGAMQHMSPDENGRIILSPKLKAAIGVTDMAVFVGLGQSFQIWAPAAHESYQAEMEADGADPFAALDWGASP